MWIIDMDLGPDRRREPCAASMGALLAGCPMMAHNGLLKTATFRRFSKPRDRALRRRPGCTTLPLPEVHQDSTSVTEPPAPLKYKEVRTPQDYGGRAIEAVRRSRDDSDERPRYGIELR